MIECNVIHAVTKTSVEGRSCGIHYQHRDESPYTTYENREINLKDNLDQIKSKKLTFCSVYSLYSFCSPFFDPPNDWSLWIFSFFMCPLLVLHCSQCFIRNRQQLNYRRTRSVLTCGTSEPHQPNQNLVEAEIGQFSRMVRRNMWSSGAPLGLHN